MSGREMVKRLEEDFQWAEGPVRVELRRSQITALLLWMNAPHTRPEWDEEMRSAQIDLAFAYCTSGPAFQDGLSEGTTRIGTDVARSQKGGRSGRFPR